MIAALVSVAIAAAIAPMIFQRAMLVRMPWVGLRSTARSDLGWSLQAFAYHAFVGMLGAAALQTFGGLAAIGVVAFWYTGKRSFVPDLVRLARLRKLVERGRDEDLAEAAKLSILAVEEMKRHGATNARQRIVLAAARVIGAADPKHAVKLLETIIVPMEGAPSWDVQLFLAALRIVLGDLPAAEEALDRCVGDPPSKAHEAQRELLRARILAATERGEEALLRAGERTGIEWDGVRAHALASLGKNDEARDALLRVKETPEGAAYLSEMARRAGPAAALAATLMADDHPYR